MSALSELLQAIAAGDVPDDVPAACDHPQEVRQMLDYLADLARFARAMAAGDLSATIQRRGSLAGSLKGLHANLRHLTWQTQQVAGGDFKQRVQFLGEFSTAFNSMVEALANARDELVKKNYQLATAYQKLKTAQAQLLQQEKMASIGQLAAGMAHEINNPIGFVLSNLGTLRAYGESLKQYVDAADRTVAAATEAERAKLAELRRKLDVDYIFEDMPAMVGESASGAKRVQDIVKNLKNFSHVDEAEVQRICINESLIATIKTVATTLGSGIKFVNDFGDLPLIDCRPHQISQLFYNLLLNAGQAIAEHGEIRVQTRRDGDFVVVAVTDTGCGIPKEIMNRIFEPFFTTRPVGKGTGLGLSMVYDIVKNHNGAIHVESTVGKGSTFTVRLPIRATESAPQKSTDTGAA